MKIKVTAIILVLILIPLTMTGCIQFAKEFIYEYKFWSQYDDGFTTRFGKTHSLDMPLIALVCGKQEEYDLDNVTLDFCYGGDPIAKMAIYVCPDNDNYWDFINVALDDYKNIPGVYFINEKTQSELEKGPFDIEVSWAYGLDYHFLDTWTVPQEIFNKEKGRFIFYATYVIEELSEAGELKYRLHAGYDAAEIYVYYEKNGDKVKLMKKWQ